MASRSCSSCNKDLQKVEYSANQWKKGPSAKCKSCISGGGSSSVAATTTKDTIQKQKIDSFDTKTKNTPQTEKDGKVEVDNDIFYSSKSFMPADESVTDGDESPSTPEVVEDTTAQDDFHDAKDDNEEEEEDNKRLTLERNRALSSLGRTLSASAKKNIDDTLKELAADVRDSKIPEADTNYPSPTKSISSYIGDVNDDVEADKSSFIGDINDAETDELLPPVVPEIEVVEEESSVKKEDDTKPETDDIKEDGLDTVQANQDKAKGDDWVVVDDVDLERYRQPMRDSSGENTGESEFETLVNGEKKEEKKSPWTLAQRLAKKLIVRTCCLKSVRDSNVSEEV